MMLFQYTLLFFALLGVSIAAPAQRIAPNANLEPPPVTDNTDKPLGWVYYADSSLWHQKQMILPVVVIGPPRDGHVVVVEISWFMDYLDPTEKKLASGFFEKSTKLTIGNKIRLINANTWINIAKPRLIKIEDLKWDKSKASALMKLNRLLEFVPLFKTVITPNGSPPWAHMTAGDIQKMIDKEGKRG
ncbi:hypothetical protein F5887DRAFT_985441 [Amanita rubescens]|nr:hypothetical protein F5887DRAFT_985441 [Amanita rubescens]